MLKMSDKVDFFDKNVKFLNEIICFLDKYCLKSKVDVVEE